MSNAIKNRHEIVFFIQAKQSNYNGDPDFDNLPRIDLQTNHGYMTDVSIKRLVRDYITNAFAGKEGYDIFVKNSVNMNRNIASCVIEASGNEKVTKGKKSAEAGEIAKKKFYDVRTFGGVLSTGLNAGQIQGAVQFDMPISYDEVQVSSVTLTRVAYTDKEFTSLEEYDAYDKTIDDDKKRTMGKKSICSYALFECHAFVSANLAQKNGFSEEDLDVLLESILNMYNYQTSASKNGVSVVGPVIIFKHIGTTDDNNVEQKAREALLGCTSAQKLFKLINVVKKDNVDYPRDYTDYEASIALSKLPAGVKVGFKYDPFAPVIWDHVDIDDEWFKES
jgi:CRISPR-associated protein Csd2